MDVSLRTLSHKDLAVPVVWVAHNFAFLGTSLLPFPFLPPSLSPSLLLPMFAQQEIIRSPPSLPPSLPLSLQAAP